jgi:hypothetical protein
LTRRARGASILLLGWVAACGPARESRPSVEADYGERFHLGVGETAEVGGKYRVRFERVAGDTRCPQGTRCIEAGSASVVFGVESERGTATLTLQTGREPRSATAMGGELRLDVLEPIPMPGGAPPSEYRAALVVRAAP